jgi:hypothetical protein
MDQNPGVALLNSGLKVDVGWRHSERDVWVEEESSIAYNSVFALDVGSLP